MSFDLETLYKLLPAIYRIRDTEQSESLEAVLSPGVKTDLPLKALLAVIAEQIAVLEEDLAQLYDNQFIETCAEWVIPYIGDLVGYHTLHGTIPSVRSPRADVANTLDYRRRKGTAHMLEQLVRDVTGWHARVVEFFQLLATTQRMNHLRPGNLSMLDVRHLEPLERLDTSSDSSARTILNTPFDTLAHSVDVRSIVNRQGRYNMPSVGIFIWRLKAYSLTDSPAFKLDEQRYMFSQLGQNSLLFNLPQAEDEATFFAQPINLPVPIGRRALDQHLNDYYGSGKSFSLMVDGQLVDADQVVVHNLSDTGEDRWANMPRDGKIAVDPVLGRIAFAEPQKNPVHVSFHYGFSADMGGGEYDRADTFNDQLQAVQQVPVPHANIQDALNALGECDGAIEITDNGRYEGSLAIQAAANQHIELRASNLKRPILVLDEAGKHEQSAEISISGDDGSEVTLNGLVISGGRLHISGKLSRLNLRHCTLVPGLALSRNGMPRHPSKPSLVVGTEDTTVEIDHCIAGMLRVMDSAKVYITNSIVDTSSEETEEEELGEEEKESPRRGDPGGRPAYAAPGDRFDPGGELHIENSAITGRVSTVSMVMASNSIFMGQVHVERRQAGCVRYSYLPPSSRVPRRYLCQPKTESDAGRVRPQFTSLCYGTPGYYQLGQGCATEILQGADDEAEMGAFHDLNQPQREINLRVRLNEYLRFGLEAGIFYAT